MNYKLLNTCKNFHYYSSNLILSAEVKNHLGLNQTLLGFKKNKYNYIDTFNYYDNDLIENNFKVKKPLNQIIKINQPKLVLPSNNFIWFYRNSFYLQYYNKYQRDINGILFQIQPNKKDIIKNLLKII